MKYNNASNSSTKIIFFEGVKIPYWNLKLAVVASVVAVGFIGNLLVLVILKRRKTKTRAPYEYFVGNLSIADLAFEVAIVTYYHYHSTKSIMPLFFCKTLIQLVATSKAVSVYTVTAIAVFRLKAITSLNFKPARKVIHGTIVWTWIVGYVLYIPLFLVMDVDPTTGFCYENLQSYRMMNKVYTVVLFLVQYIPFDNSLNMLHLNNCCVVS